MKIKQIVLTLLISLTFISCSKFNALIKSNNTQEKYDKALEFYHNKKYNKAMALFENIMPNMIGTAQEDTVLFYVGKSYYNLGNYEQSAEALNYYRNQFSRSDFTEEAEYLYAMSFYNMSPPPEKDQTSTRQAIIAFNEYLNRYPESIQTTDIQHMIEEMTQKLYYKTFINASLYYKLRHYNAAITSLRDGVREYPEIPYREEMMYMICKSWYDYARNSIHGRQLDRYLKMIDSYYNFCSAYPNNKQFMKELNYMFEKSKEYAAQHGTQSQELEKNQVTIEDRKGRILENKDKLFYIKDEDARKEVKKQITDDRKAIKAERKAMKVTEKELKKSKVDKTQKLKKTK